MNSKNDKIAIRRNTVYTTKSLVEVLVMSLLRTEVPDGGAMFSFDPELPANEHLVFAIDGQSTREWTQHISEPFQLRNWCVKRFMLVSEETGDESPALRVTLIDPEGETMSFVSVGIAQSLDLFRTLRGDGPYEPAIPVIVKPIKTRRGYQTLKLHPVNLQNKQPAKKS